MHICSYVGLSRYIINYVHVMCIRTNENDISEINIFPPLSRTTSVKNLLRFKNVNFNFILISNASKAREKREGVSPI